MDPPVTGVNFATAYITLGRRAQSLGHPPLPDVSFQHPTFHTLASVHSRSRLLRYGNRPVIDRFTFTNARGLACKDVHIMHAPCIHLNSSVHRPHAHRSSPIRPHTLPHRSPRKAPFASRRLQQMHRAMYVLRRWPVRNSGTDVGSMRRCLWIAAGGLCV